MPFLPLAKVENGIFIFIDLGIIVLSNRKTILKNNSQFLTKDNNINNIKYVNKSLLISCFLIEQPIFYDEILFFKTTIKEDRQAQGK